MEITSNLYIKAQTCGSVAMDKLNKKRPILRFVLIAIGITLCALVIYQFPNIKTLLNWQLYSAEELEQKITTSKSDLDEKLAQYMETPISDLTIEQEKELLAGRITYEEAVKIIDNNVKNNPSSDASQKTTAEAAVAAAVKTCVGKLYAVKAAYLLKLGGLEKQAYAEFLALPSSEHNNSNKTKILSRKLKEAAAYESQCDASVNKILSDLSSELKAYNGDQKVVGILKKAYEDEKVLKKSYYLNLME